MARFAITDIHGCVNTFRQLVENTIGLTKKDTLYLLGDYVNKGPDSKGVLDYIFSLLESGYHIICLRGNHDQVLLDAIDIGKGANWLSEPDQKQTLLNFGANCFEDINEKYLRFIRSLPLYLQLEDYVLVHAGCDFSMSSEALFNDPYTLMNARNFIADSKKLQERVLLHGHTPVAFTQIEKSVRNREPAINLDAGCVYYKNGGLGSLTALNLDTFTLLNQQNTDKPYHIDKK